MNSWLKWLRNAPRDALALCLALRDPNTPWQSKVVVGLSILYVLLPVDIIPDFIPIIGFLDDLAALPLAGYLARRYMQPGLVDNLRYRADSIIRRLRPKLFAILVAIVILWMIAASYVSWRLWKGQREAIRERPALVVPEEVGVGNRN